MTGGDPGPIEGNQSTSSEPPSEPPATKPMHPRLRTLLGWVVFLVVVLLAATGARAYAVESYFVPTPSMVPTLMPGDRIIVNKLASTIHRGDIVVFNHVPADSGGPPVLVKRVIGLPGETISSTGSTVLIDGKPLAEPWLPPLTGMCNQATEHITTTVVAPDHYFMMGDCRGSSGDSRYFGTVPGSYIIGKVDLIIWRHGHPWVHWF